MVKRTLILIIALELFLGTSSSFGAYEWVLLDGELNMSGPDRLLSIPTDITALPGTTVSVPVLLDDGTDLLCLDIGFSYDTDVFFDVGPGDLTLGGLLSSAGGWLLVSSTGAPGQVYVCMYGFYFLSGGSGSVLEVNFSVRPDAPLGPTTIHLLESFCKFNAGETGVVLTLQDGIVTIATEHCTPVSIESLTAYPLVVPIGDPVDFEATFVDGCGEVDALWDFGDGTFKHQTNVTSPVTATHTYNLADVYEVELTLSDDKVDVGDSIDVVVYDPDGPFITGHGSIYSPAGAYKPDSSLEGTATFVFTSMYNKGTTVPTGTTIFKFRIGDLNFHSTSYDWLVVTGSSYARFKGIGTINGSGQYRFMLWVGDSPDTFRIKIWEEDDEGNETVIYDNGFDQGITGTIVIHD